MAECDSHELRDSSVPDWHPLALVALLVTTAIAGLLLAGRGGESPTPPRALITQAYLPMLLVSWGLLLYVCRIGRPRFALVELLGLNAATPARALGDLALAVVVVAVLLGGEVAWQLVFGHARSAAADALLPSTPLEKAVWCAVALSAALSEEVVYRGYFVRVLSRFTGRTSLAVLGQAVLFALAHGEQGGSTMLRFFVYAVGLGVLAVKRGSLVPAIVAHAGVDLLAGLTH